MPRRPGSDAGTGFAAYPRCWAHMKERHSVLYRRSVIAPLVACGTCACVGTTVVMVAVDVPVAAPPRAVSELVRELSATESHTRALAAWDLAGAVDLPAEVVARLKALRSDPSREVRYAAAWAVGHVVPWDAKVEPATTGGTPPKVKRQTRPAYPADAFRRKIQGSVAVEILIGEFGEVAHVEVRKSIPGLDQATVACVRQWTFEPARVNGVARATLGRTSMSFRIY